MDSEELRPLMAKMEKLRTFCERMLQATVSDNEHALAFQRLILALAKASSPSADDDRSFATVEANLSAREEEVTRLKILLEDMRRQRTEWTPSGWRGMRKEVEEALHAGHWLDESVELLSEKVSGRTVFQPPRGNPLSRAVSRASVNPEAFMEAEERRRRTLMRRLREQIAALERARTALGARHQEEALGLERRVREAAEEAEEMERRRRAMEEAGGNVLKPLYYLTGGLKAEAVA